METQTFLFRLLCALAAGILIGIERQMRKRSAGLATNALVAVGACIFILISETVIADTQGGSIKLQNDNLRVLAQIVAGVGFLGAGAIIKDGFTIHGLNSAATIWCAAAVGSLCGFGYWQLALIATCVIIFINWVLKNIEIEVERYAHRKEQEAEAKNFSPCQDNAASDVDNREEADNHDTALSRNCYPEDRPILFLSLKKLRRKKR